jgi:hypothetical protein
VLGDTRRAQADADGGEAGRRNRNDGGEPIHVNIEQALAAKGEMANPVRAGTCRCGTACIAGVSAHQGSCDRPT